MHNIHLIVSIKKENDKANLKMLSAQVLERCIGINKNVNSTKDKWNIYKFCYFRVNSIQYDVIIVKK